MRRKHNLDIYLYQRRWKVSTESVKFTMQNNYRGGARHHRGRRRGGYGRFKGNSYNSGYQQQGFHQNFHSSRGYGMNQQQGDEDFMQQQHQDQGGAYGFQQQGNFGSQGFQQQGGYGRWKNEDGGGRGGKFRKGDSGERQQYGGADGGGGRGGRERPPPGLRGKEIGLWYAKRSKAKKEREQKANRPTVSIAKDKETKIRHLLDQLRDSDDRQEGQSTSSSASCSLAEAGFGQASHFSGFKRPMDEDVKRGNSSFYNTSSTQYVCSNKSQEERRASVKEEPCESWEDLCDSDSNQEDSIKDEVITPEEAELLQEKVIDLDDYDDDGTLLPSLTGVMEYMSSHADYPYQADEDTKPEMIPEERERNTRLDQEMIHSMKALESNPNFIKMREFRRKLPSYNMRKTIVDTINGSQVVVISGETGCGKTTQVPQFILDDYIEQGRGSQCSVICTQPRRISAISVAERVASERCEKVGSSGNNSIGYQIRLEVRKPRNQGSILFCTTGIVLKFLERDPRLHRATHVIIDEIHERDLQSDFLMIILKDLLPLRPDLKVILMSATLNAEMFSEYFDNCPMLNIPGYTFPVKEYLLEEILELTNYTGPTRSTRPWKVTRDRKKRQEQMEMEEKYRAWCRQQVGKYNDKTIEMLAGFDYSVINLDLVLHIVQYITTQMGEGAILVFLPGWEDIKKLNEKIQASMRAHASNLRVIPLHSLMPTVNQREVFERPPPGIRKIVIATNIAETSITIDDVVFVIDCGKIKVKGFEPEMNLTSLEPQWVSKANARQRRGRAGRVQDGYCFHLYTEFHYQTAEDYLLPEMLRTRLEELCLQIKLLKLGRIIPFISKAMQHPSMTAIEHAVDTLIELRALDAEENLLPLGYHLARMPLEPHTGKMILFGAMFGCLDPILTVAASLSFKDAFVIPMGQENNADKARNVLAKGTKSDHIMLINAFQGWEESFSRGSSYRYCREHFLSENTLKLLRDMKRQLAEVLYDIKFLDSKNPKDADANINSNNESMLRAVICAGLYPNVAQILRVPRGKKQGQTISMGLRDQSKVFAHPKSVNVSGSFFESKWMVFYTKLRTAKVYLHDTTMVSPYSLLFFGGKLDIKREVVSVDDWMVFNADSNTAYLVKELRNQLDEVLTKKITHPGPTQWNRNAKEGAIMTAIADLISTEKLGTGAKDDGSIGQQEEFSDYRR